MSTPLKVLLIILVILVVALIVLYFIGRRMQKRQTEQRAQMEAMKQTVTMLIIDKKMLPLNKSGLPQMVKAKVGPRIMTLVADNEIFDLIPLKKEVKAVVSGIYIMSVRGIRGPLEQPEKKLGFWARQRKKLSSLVSGSGKKEAK